MSNHQEDLELAIVKWISTFEDLPEHPSNFESLADGIILMDIMNKISPDFFDLDKINKDACESWALRHHNLTHLYERLENFYKDVLKLPFDKNYVDCLKISKNNDREHLYNLIEVVIGAAIQCQDKEKYINAILSLDEVCQNELMLLIEKVLNRGQADKPGEKSASNSDSFEHLAKGSPSRLSLQFGKVDYQEKRLLAKIEELENENQQLSHKLTDMAQEKETMRIKIADFAQEVERKNQEIRHLMADRDKALEKLAARDSHDELEKEVKLRDRKIDELEKFIEELKQKHEANLCYLQDEVNAGRRKIAELSKIEGTMDFYQQKYDDYTKLNVRVSDLDVQVEELKTELDEVREVNKGLLNKIEVYKEKLEAEKTKNISMDIDATKKKAEIDSLKSEKKRLEFINNELEGKINDLNKFLERVQREQQDSARHHRSTDRALNQMTGQDFTELIRGLERENEALRSGKKGSISMIEDGEKEILEKENEILKAKCIEIQTENEAMKDQVAKSRDIQVMERLLRENANLKEEVDKLKKKVPSPRMKIMENAKYEDRIQEMQEEIENRGIVIKDLNGEVEALKNVIDEIEDQKLTELRLMGSALQELAVRNVNLENQIKSFREQAGSHKMNPLAQLNPNITPINYNIRR